MSTDLGSIDVDPLSVNMLLNPNRTAYRNDNSEDDDSDAASGGEDWSKFAPAWSDSSLSLSSSFGKPYNDFMLSDFPTTTMDTDLSVGMGMDYSYPSTMGIDPASLHFNTAAAGLGLGYGYGDATGFADSYGAAAAVAAYSFQQLHQHSTFLVSAQAGEESASPQSFTKERRLSITSSSSSSAASLSSPSPPSRYTSDNVAVSTKEEPAAELAHRVRQSAGLMLAVPVNGFGASFQAGANVSAGKLPIPRLSRPSTASYAKSTTTAPPSSSSSAASTPPPSTPPSTSHSPLNLSITASAASANVPNPTLAPAAPIPRPKTSHTTIERRYRTNLNARIQSLRMAVPALRVLEDRDGSNGKKIKKNIKGGVVVKGGGIGIGVECSEDGSVVDVIDERGFVDGVKVARKCSKANVLGKAVEYIRVLKRRERRLKAELAGVKVLVEGLVGGPALIREWEQQWRARFGGEEKDEVEGDEEDGEGEDDDSDEEDGDDGDEDAGRKRKRARVSNSSSMAGGPSKKVDSKKEKKPAPPLVPPVLLLAGEQSANPVPEKRKRGRPRKILPPPVTLEAVATPALLSAAVIVQKHGGSVKQDEVMQPPTTETLAAEWPQQQQRSPPQQYLLAVFALFSFFNSPLTSSSSMGHDYSHNHHHHMGKVLTPLYPPLAYSPEIVSQFVQPVAMPPAVWKEYVQLFHLAVSFLILASFVGSWFGFGFGVTGFSLEKRGWGWHLTSRKGKRGKEKKGNEDWIKVAEESVLLGEASSLSHFERWQIYRKISERGQDVVASLVSAAIALNSANGVVSGGLARMKARKIWDCARRKVQGNNTGTSSKRRVEELVFGSTDLDGACERLAGCVTGAYEMSDGEGAYSPIEVLACGVVKERLRSHLRKLFVDFVGGHEDEEEEDEEGTVEEEERRRKTFDASRELGGSVEEMGRLFERMWKIGVGVGSVDLGDVERVFSNMHTAGGVDEEIQALFVALVLYARLFGQAHSDSESSEESDTETETERGLSSSKDTVDVSASSSSWSLLSPPPSPGPATWPSSLALPVTSNLKSAKRAKMMLELRGVLGCRVFEGNVGGENVDLNGMEGLEEARDRVVDLIVEFERRDR